MATRWTHAGAMRHHLIIEAIDVTPTTDGETANTVSIFGRVWASISPLSGSERYVAAMQQDTSTHKINCRWFPGVTPKMQARLSIPGQADRVFNFTSVNNVEERNIELEIMGTEVLA